MIKSAILTSLAAVLSFAPMAIAFPVTQADIALIAIANNAKKESATDTYNAMRRLLPSYTKNSESQNALWKAAQYVHRTKLTCKKIQGMRNDETDVHKRCGYQ